MAWRRVVQRHGRLRYQSTAELEPRRTNLGTTNAYQKAALPDMNGFLLSLSADCDSAAR